MGSALVEGELPLPGEVCDIFGGTTRFSNDAGRVAVLLAMGLELVLIQQFDDATGPHGDIKVEVFGDGSSRATSESYTATSYVIIFGGWSNSTNAIARLDEHGDDRAVGPRHPVEMSRVYHLRIERQGNRITSWADDVELAHMDDPQPLEGRGHDHFAFNDWEADLWFDNLRIEPL